MRKQVFVCASLLLAFALPLCVFAQRILGEFTGTVMDPSGAAVVGAKVTARDLATGREWTTTTNEAGVFRIVSVPGGSAYEISVEQQGFRAVKRQEPTLDVGETRRVDVTLQVGAVAETVEVTSEATPLNLEKGEVSAVVNERKIVDLPLNGRNIYQLAELQPGIIRTAGSGVQDSETTDARISASGTRYRDNQILLDGVTNNNDRQGGRTTLSLSPDAVEQFRVVTNNLSAEFGRSGGAVVSVITKSGTNNLHGSAFWFHRNDNLDAGTTFQNRIRNGKPEFKRNHFGATAGGPIWRDHTFFFFSYQGLRERRPALQQHTVETPQFRDFVVRTRPNSLAARLLRDFPPTLNPTTNIRDIGSPAPGVRVAGPPDGIPDLGEVFLPVNGFTSDNQYSIRFDHSFNGGRDLITGRYSINDRLEQRPGDNSARVFTVDFIEPDQNAGLSFTHVFSPNVVNDFRLGWNYDPQVNTATNMDIPYVGMNAAGRSVSQFSQTFGYVFPLDFRLHTYHLYDAVNVTRGRHGLKFGGEFRAFQENSDFPTFARPLISFEDLMDFADDEVLSIQARVDPNTGRPAGTYRNFRLKEWGLFVQDDWKATPRLTLNIGVRYDNFGTLKEKNDLLSTIEFDAAALGAARMVPVSELYKRDNNNFAPRFGFAWDPTGNSKWAIRGGTGIFYSRIWTNFSGNIRFNTPFTLPVTLSALSAQNPSAYYRIPFAGDPAFARPLDQFGGSTVLRPTVQTVDRGLRAPYTWHWFLGAQRRLGSDWVLEANYLGNAGRKLLFRNQINRYSGDRADGVVNRVHQSFTGMTHGYNAASSIYHALTAQATKRFSRSYTVQVAYTFSRSIDNDSEAFGGGAGEQEGSMEVSNLRLDRGLSAFDATHRLAGNFLWDLPFFRNASGPVRAIAGGWQFNGIVSLQSGFPFTVITSDDFNLDGTFADRPDIATSMARVVGEGPHDFLNGVFGPRTGWANVFRTAPGRNGNLGRNTFRGPGFASVDLSLFKDFRMGWPTEEARWQLRAEAFNAFNRVNLRAPSNSLGTFNAATGLWSSTTFGTSSSGFEARQLQLALKFIF